MNIIKVCAFCLTAIILILILKEQNKVAATMVSITAGIILMIYIVTNLSGITEVLESISKISKVESKYLSLVLKIAGITYLIEFSKNLCADAGESAIGTKLEMAGKVMIVTLALPVLTEVISQIVSVL